MERLPQPNDGINRRVLCPRLDLLNVTPAQVGFLRQALLGELRNGAKAAKILSENNMGSALHLAHDAERGKVESEL